MSLDTVWRSMYFRHVEANEFHAHGDRQLPRHFGFADARGAGKQVKIPPVCADRPSRTATF